MFNILHIIYMYIYIYIYIYIYMCVCVCVCMCVLDTLFMYRCYYVNLFLENSSIFSHNFFTDFFGLAWTITYSKKFHGLKISAESF